MSDDGSIPSADRERAQGAEFADINITAQGDRRTLEALYLELRELAKQNGLKVEYELSLKKPAGQGDS
jgi:hypothetical protein